MDSLHVNAWPHTEYVLVWQLNINRLLLDCWENQHCIQWDLTSETQCIILSLQCRCPNASPSLTWTSYQSTQSNQHASISTSMLMIPSKNMLISVDHCIRYCGLFFSQVTFTVIHFYTHSRHQYLHVLCKDCRTLTEYLDTSLTSTSKLLSFGNFSHGNNPNQTMWNHVPFIALPIQTFYPSVHLTFHPPRFQFP